MIGIVVVSHSRALAQAAVALAAEMTPEPPSIAVAAGVDETTFGTDAVAISDAIAEVDSPEGVLVLLDVGSAILSAEMALEFLDPEGAERVRLSPAPLVEGLIAAVVTAASGAGLDEVAAEASEGARAKHEQLTGDASWSEVSRDDQASTTPGADTAALVGQWTINNPHGLHARPSAAVVAALRGIDARVQVTNASTGAGPADAASLSRLATLGLRQGQVLSASISGPHAQQALEVLDRLAATDFGERVTPDPAAGDRTAGERTEGGPTSTTDDPALAPDTVSSHQAASGTQVVLGPVHHASGEVDLGGYQPEADEGAHLRAALTVVHHRLGGADDEILAMQAVMLDDPELLDQLHAGLAASEPATVVVDRVFSAAAAEFEALDDPYQAERAQDLRSLRRLVVAELVGQPPDDAAIHAHVLVVPELDAATAAGLDPGLCLGVVTLQGGSTGHGVIIATGRGIPVLTGHDELADVTAGTAVGLDPVTGKVWVDPDAATRDEIAALQRSRQADETHARELAHEPALTRDGRTIRVEANIGSLEDARRAVSTGAEGSGLVRTELLFGHLGTAPTAEQQAEVFVEIGQVLAPHPITIRTWDVGGDKPLPFLAQAAEANPFLGERGLRTMRRVPEFFTEQLRGIAMAARQVPVRVMFPMVTEPDEMHWARQMMLAVIDEVGVDPFPIGMMVEVPAAALRAAEFAGLADFISIGTNDLTQYTTATDRSNAVVSHLARSDSPGVLALMRMTCHQLPWVPVAVCGDLASTPAMVASLVEMGITELSCRPPLVPQVKQAVRQA